MEETTYPKYQWSYFINGKRDEQVVVRAFHVEELKNSIEAVKKLFPEEPTAEPSKPLEATATGYACKQCGSPTVFKQGTSKAGKPWRGYFCTVEKDHVSWLK